MKFDAVNLSCFDESEASLFGYSSFSIPPGEKVAIVIDNSFIASLLCNALGGILSRIHPAYRLTGSVLIDGSDILHMDIHERIKLVTYVPPDSELLLSGVKDTVFGEVALGLELRGVSVDEIFRRVTDILEKLQIEHLSERNPDELSGGERHKVSLATVFVTRPSTLILENPGLFLDGPGFRSLIKILRDYAGTVIISDPNPLLWGAVATGFILEGNQSFYYAEPSFVTEKILTGNWALESPPWLDVMKNLKESDYEVPTPDSTSITEAVKTFRRMGL
jgi:energy-coupling factor transporter ATP-binding protein EcfA2